MGVTTKPPRRGRRLAPETRRALLLETATVLVLEQGFLPLGVPDLAEAARVSKALVYRYFPEPHDLYNALLERCVERLLAAGLEASALPEDLAETYFRYVAANGPLIQIILRDRFMAGRVSRRAAAVRDRVARRLARNLRREFGVDLREAVASVSIGMTMPEECGRLAYQGDLDLERGAVMCRELVSGVIDVARRRGLETVR
jgi:AcrR family transcriptional regulator